MPDARMPHARMADGRMPGRRVSVPGVASDWLRPRLGRTWRGGIVVGVGPRAAYVAVGVLDGAATRRGLGASTREVLAIEGPDGVGLPNGIRLGDRSVLARLSVGDRVVLRGSRLRVGADVEVAVARWERSRPVPGPATMAMVARRLAGLDAAMPGRARMGDTDSALAAGADGLVAVAAGTFTGSPAVVVDHLLGRGPGSTPAGDDLLAGFLATMAVLATATGGHADLARLDPVGARVHGRADTHTTPLSATLLRCALDGAMARPAADLLVAMTAADRDGADPGRTRAAAAALERVGHTSGRDLATGILAALHHLTGTFVTTSARAHDAPARPVPRPVPIPASQPIRSS